MKRDKRIKLSCWKKMSNGKIESFVVIVNEDRKDIFKRDYEERGYNVSEV